MTDPVAVAPLAPDCVVPVPLPPPPSSVGNPPVGNPPEGSPPPGNPPNPPRRLEELVLTATSTVWDLSEYVLWGSGDCNLKVGAKWPTMREAVNGRN